MTSYFCDIADPKDIALRINETQIEYFKKHIGTLLEQHAHDNKLLSEICENAVDEHEINIQEFIDGRFMKHIDGLYTPAEQNFILKICEKSEHIKLGFAYFSLLNGDERAAFALSSADKHHNIGWKAAGFDYALNDSTDDQKIPREDLATYIFSKESIEETTERFHPYHYLNTVNTLTGYFTDDGTISKDEKYKIDRLALTLITSAKPDNYIACHIDDTYIFLPETKAWRDQCHDIGYIETAIEALYIAQSNTEKDKAATGEANAYDEFKPFWENTYDRLKTDRASVFFTVLKELNEQNTPLPPPDMLLNYVQKIVIEREGNNKPSCFELP